MAGEPAAAWRLFSFNWFLLGALAVTLALGLVLTGFSLTPTGAVLPFGAAALFTALAYGIAWRARHRDPKWAFVFGSAAQLVLVIALMTPLTYVAASADLPLRDQALAALDRALGLDWRGYLDFVNAQPGISKLFAIGYAMITWPMFAIPVLLGAQRRFVRLQQFTIAVALALIATTLISALAPALGAFHGLGLKPDAATYLSPVGYLDELRDFPLVRDGSLRELDIQNLVGIVTFPSFHGAAAILYLWVLWSIWWMRPAAIMGNAVMLLATPIGGGHYFVDVFAGVGVAVLAIAGARIIGERVMGGAGAPDAVRLPETVAEAG
jgi:hypothetical protein